MTGQRRRRRLIAATIGLGALAGSFAAGTGVAQASPTDPGTRAAFTAPTYVKSIGQVGDAFVYPWGMATETNSRSPFYGDIIVGDYNNYNVKVFAPINSTTAAPGTLVATIGQRGSAANGSMGQPYGIAVDPNDGSIYVADQNNFRVDKYNNAGVFQYVIAPSGGYYIAYVAVNASGDVFITQSTVLSPTGRNVIFEYSNTGTLITTYVGTNGTSCSAGQVGNIRGVSVDSTGLLYVDDVTNRCIQVFNTTTTPWTFVRSIGRSGTLSADTRNLTIDRANGIIYVGDAAKNVIDVFTTAGAFLGTIGTSGSGDGQLGGARGAAVGLDGTIYASDYTYWRINAYAALPSGAYLNFVIPDPPVPPPPGGFNNPTAVSVSTFPGSRGDVYVADTFNQRIQEFSTTGTVLNYWGSRLPQLNAPYAFDYPRGVAVDPATGDVWVNDTRSGYIKEYTANGTFIAEYGGPGDFDYAVGIYVANGKVLADDSDHDQLQALSTTTGAELPGFPVTCGTGVGYGDNGGCTGVTTDAAGNIYAAAEEENLVEVYNPSGKLIGTIKSSANLSGPYDVAVVGTTLFVTDANSNRVTEFNISLPTSATLLGTWGTTGSGKGAFSSPRGISADASGNIYIVDYGNSRVEEFKP
jgi:DNA-binding beta-propeller fold protein YncE